MTEDSPTRPQLSSLQLVQRSPAMRVLNRCLVALLIALLLALVAIPWQQNVAGMGRVVAFDPFDRVQRIAAPVGGRVDRAWVVEGSRVEKGDPLLEIVDNDPSILRRLNEQRAALEAQLDAAEERVGLFGSQVGSLESARELAVESAERQVEVARAAVASARYGLDATRAAEDQAQRNFERHQGLVEEGLASELEFEVAERTAKEAKARVAQARQTLAASQADLQAKIAELGRVRTEKSARIDSTRASGESAEVDVAALRERLTALEVRIAQQNTQRVTAPRAGTVLRLFASPGAELVRAGDPLLELVPDTAGRAVELWVDGNDVPLIQPGRTVRIQFEGWPAVQFSGWPSVAVGTFGGRVALVDSSDDGRGRFRLLVSPDPDDEPWPEGAQLRQGARAKGFVLLDRVRLGYELWRQANGFPPTVAMGGESPEASETGGPT